MRYFGGQRFCLRAPETTPPSASVQETPPILAKLWAHFLLSGLVIGPACLPRHFPYKDRVWLSAIDLSASSSLQNNAQLYENVVAGKNNNIEVIE